MNKESSFVCQNIEVPESVLLRREQGNKYGSVPGLDDTELADPVELEREVILEEWGPVLGLPVKGNSSGIRPVVDENGGLDWGAFGTFDFRRTMPEFDKARYKADKIREQLKDVLIMLGIVNERIKTNAKYLLLKYLRMNIIRMEHIIDFDMRALARLSLKARRLRNEIQRLVQVSESGRRRRLERFWNY